MIRQCLFCSNILPPTILAKTTLQSICDPNPNEMRYCNMQLRARLGSEPWLRAMSHCLNGHLCPLHPQPAGRLRPRLAGIIIYLFPLRCTYSSLVCHRIAHYDLCTSPVPDLSLPGMRRHPCSSSRVMHSAHLWDRQSMTCGRAAAPPPQYPPAGSSYSVAGAPHCSMDRPSGNSGGHMQHSQVQEVVRTGKGCTSSCR